MVPLRAHELILQESKARIAQSQSSRRIGQGDWIIERAGLGEIPSSKLSSARAVLSSTVALSRHHQISDDKIGRDANKRCHPQRKYGAHDFVHALLYRIQGGGV